MEDTGKVYMGFMGALVWGAQVFLGCTCLDAAPMDLNKWLLSYVGLLPSCVSFFPSFQAVGHGTPAWCTETQAL